MTKTRNLNELAAVAHKDNTRWWVDITKPDLPRIERNISEMGMLAVSELAEALEGHRKNKKDDKLPQYPMAVVELADCVIRVLDTVHGLGFRFDQPEFDGWLMPHFLTSTPNFGQCLFDITREVQRLYDLLRYELKQTQHNSDPLPLSQRASVVVGHCILTSHLFFPDIDFWEVYDAKMEYNRNRDDHKIENRLKADGKKY